MARFVVREEVLHYAAAFLERWAEKSPNKNHELMAAELRKLSNHLLDNLYVPLDIIIARHIKQK